MTPRHLMIPVDENGDGPCTADETRAFRCWCGKDCGTLEHVLAEDGTPVCKGGIDVDTLMVMEAQISPVPGFCPDCHAYAMSLLNGMGGGQS